MHSKTPQDGPIQIGDLSLDPRQRSVRRGSETISLPRLSFDLLLCLARHAPAVVTMDQLLTEVWGDVVVGDETVKQRISMLRQSLGESGGEPRYLESVRSVGYRLIPDVGAEEPATACRPPRKTTIATGSLASSGRWCGRRTDKVAVP